MMITLIIFLSLLLSILTESPLSKCFYNRTPPSILEKIAIINSSPMAVLSPGYAYQVVWDVTQYNVETSAFAFTGYRIQAGDSLLSFNAAINNVSSTNAQFIFYPQAGSAIIQAHFSIILRKTCTGYMELHYVEFIPPELSQPTRSEQFSYTSIPLSRAIGIDRTHYQTAAFLSAFILASFTGQVELQIVVLPFATGSTIIKFKIYSGAGHQNVYPKICFTFIIIDISTFDYQVSTYVSTYQARTLTYPSLTITPNFGIPSNFNPQLNQKCVIAFTWILTYRNSTITEMVIVDSGTSSVAQINSVSILNNRFMVYSLICIQDCVNGYVVLSQSTYVCVPCALGIDQCERCYPLPNLMCAGCTSGNYLMLNLNKCFTSCLPGYYGNGTYVCQPCLDACLTCNNSQTCISCKFGWMVEGGCTDVEGCSTIFSWSSPSHCLHCRQDDLFELIGERCRCKEGYILITHLCIDTIGCIAARKINNKTICVACNINHGFVLNGSQCSCTNGYQLVVDFCIQKCGDGILFKDECDDGNTINGDGCSSKCKAEKFYQCSNGSATSPSICKYYGNISLSVKHINKINLKNQGIFTFTLTPSLSIFDSMDFNKNLTFECSQPITIKKISYIKGQLTVIVDYLEDLQGNPAKLTLELDPSHFSLPKSVLKFNMNSEGSILVSNNYQRIQIIEILSIALSFVVLLIFVASGFIHKMIGVELLNTFQVIYLVHLSSDNYTDTFGILKNLSLLSWKLYPFDSDVNISSIWLNVPFSLQAEQITVIFMGTVLTVFSIIFLFSISQNVVKFLDQDDQGHRIKNSSLSLFIYNHILFPFAIGFWLVFLPISIGEGMHNEISSQIVKNLFAPTMVLISLIFVLEWKNFFTSQLFHQSFAGLTQSKRSYIPFHLTSIFLYGIILSIRLSKRLIIINPFLLGIEATFLIWKIIRRPYEWKIHNIAIILNSSIIVFFMAWVIARNCIPLFRSEKIEIIFVIILFTLFAFSIILTVIRTIYEFLLYRKKIAANNERRQSKKKPKKGNSFQLMQPIKNIAVGTFSRGINNWEPTLANSLKEKNNYIFTSEDDNFKRISIGKKINNFLLQSMLQSKQT